MMINPSRSGKTEEGNRLGGREKGSLLKLGAVLLIFGVFSLTTLAKIVTYTPCSCSASVQYASNAGRRMVSDSARAADQKAVPAQRVVPIEPEDTVISFDYREDPELLPALIPGPGIVPLRSPPPILNS